MKRQEAKSFNFGELSSCLPRERRQQAAAIPPTSSATEYYRKRSDNGSFSFMQAGTRSPKAAPRHREIRGKTVAADELRGAEKWQFSERPELNLYFHMWIRVRVHNIASWGKGWLVAVF